MLDIFVKPDAFKAAQLLEEEKRERAEHIQNEQSMILDEFEMGKLKLWAPEGFYKDRHLKAWEKIARATFDGYLTLKAFNHEPHCWMHTMGCSGKAHVWVHEIGFDLKEMKASLDFAQVSSSDIEGPVPGFCIAHIHQAPAMLAERVYFDHPAVQWGFLPTRWFVRFTDGTSQRGPIEQINPEKLQPSILEEHLNPRSF